MATVMTKEINTTVAIAIERFIARVSTLTSVFRVFEYLTDTVKQ